MSEKTLAITCKSPETLMTFEEVSFEIARVLGEIGAYAGTLLDRDFEGKRRVADALKTLEPLYDRAEALANANHYAIS